MSFLPIRNRTAATHWSVPVACPELPRPLVQYTLLTPRSSEAVPPIKMTASEVVKVESDVGMATDTTGAARTGRWIVQVKDSVTALLPLDAVAVTRYVPSTRGVPLIEPVALSMLIPVGSPLAA
jgi:hypothetical protein